MEDKKKVEAVLFSLGKEISLDKLSELCALEKEKVQAFMEELKKEYEQRDHSLKILQRGDNWKLTVKDEFLPLVSKLVEGTDLDRALMETLAVIAWKYPVIQSEVIRLRHTKAYDHIKRLMELEFVEKEKFGRTYKLKLTKRFFEYFDLPSDEAKQAFLKNIPPRILQEAAKVAQEAEEVEYLVEEKAQEKEARVEIKGAIEEVRQPAKEKKTKPKEEKKTKSPEEEGEIELDEEEVPEEVEEEQQKVEKRIQAGISWVFG